MYNNDTLLLWCVVLLTLMFSLTSGRELGIFIKGLYWRFIEALKKQDFMELLVSGDMQKGKKKLGLEDQNPSTPFKQRHGHHRFLPRNSL